MTDANPVISFPARCSSFLWRLAISPVTFVVLAILWCLDLGAGSLLAYKRPDLFGTLDNYPFTTWLRLEGAAALPYSLWVYLLMVLSWLMVASLLLCTVNWFLFRRKRIRGLGEVLVHLGFLLVFAGYVIGAAWGARTLGITLPVEGGSARVENMGLGLTLREIRPITGPHGDVQGEESDLELSSSGGTARADRVRINHPLIAGSTVIYPRGVQQRVTGIVLDVEGVGRVRLPAGGTADLGTGRTMALTGLLQDGEERNGIQGPGALLTLYGPGRAPLATAWLSPREGESSVAVMAGQKVALAALEGPYLARYDLHRDPGVQLVLVGAVLITLGTLWAFGGYLREGLPPA